MIDFYLITTIFMTLAFFYLYHKLGKAYSLIEGINRKIKCSELADQLNKNDTKEGLINDINKDINKFRKGKKLI